MDCNTNNKTTLHFMYVPKQRFGTINNEYRVDFWREVTKRWMVVGVLLVMTVAVLGPRAGARGGPLHTQYLSHIPLSYIYYRAGRSPVTLPSPRLLVVSCAHAHVVAPAICVAVVTALRDVTDYRVVKGALYSSVGGGCAWLSLALSRSECTAIVTAVNYVTSLVAFPLSMFVLCGRVILPSLFDVVSTCLTALIPFVFGVINQKRQNNATVRVPCDISRHCRSIEETSDSLRRNDATLTKQGDKRPRCGATANQTDTIEHMNCCHNSRWCDSTARKLCALTLLYVDCCDRLAEAEGILYIGDVVVTFVLELTWLVTSAATCWAYARVGLLPGQQARTLALCAVPKDMHAMEGALGAACDVRGLARVPPALLAPARAALLAAVAGGWGRGDDGEGGTPTGCNCW